MSDVTFEILKILVMLVVLIVTRYLVPLIKAKIGADKLKQAEKWAKYAVEMAQQVHSEKPGEDRKAIVTEFLWQILIEKNISISEEQLNVLIEAAVKEMKMQES